MKYDYDIIVIGAGGGGLTAAIGGAGIGASVLLIEGEKLGGDCTHYGCVPSKALIRAAHVAHAQNERVHVGLESAHLASQDDVHGVLSHVRSVVADIESRFENPDDIRRQGVDILMGFATFVDSHTVAVDDKKISGKKIVIAAGARPALLPIDGLADVEPKTNRTIFDADDFASLTIIGSGPIGCELGQAFARLGVDVSIVTRDAVVLGHDEVEAGKIVEQSLLDDSVALYYEKDVQSVSVSAGKKNVIVTCKKTGEKTEIVADEILVAIGRQPNVEKLGLDRAGVHFDVRRGILVNAKTQTNVPHIYAVGDIATRWKFTHYANHMAKIALTNMIFKVPAKMSEVIPRATFTAPVVASIGINTLSPEYDASVHHVLEKTYDHVDRAITDVQEDGFIRIITDSSGMIVGATIVGGPAGEMINEIALAMQNRISVTELSDTIHVYPTYGYGLRHCSDQFRALGYTKKKKKWVQRIFGLRGRG